MKCYYILIPFSFIYLLFISLRNILYNLHIFRAQAVDAKVISVGNITWGGTGKTPVVLYILETLLKRGLKVVILTRGYGNDEQRLFWRLGPYVPVKTGKNRLKNAREVTRHLADTLLLDDGFQYRRMKRDLDIVCINATSPFGNGWVIPCGVMRESKGALKRADILLITKVDLVERQNLLQNLEVILKKVNPSALIVKSIHRVEHFYRLSDNKIVDIEQLRDENLILVSAIGDPYSFEKTILRLGLKVKKHFIFRDHHWYLEKDLKKIEKCCRRWGIDTIVMTEKDAVKLRAAGDRRRAANILVLRIKLQIIENEEGFLNRLFGIYSS